MTSSYPYGVSESATTNNTASSVGSLGTDTLSISATSTTDGNTDAAYSATTAGSYGTDTITVSAGSTQDTDNVWTEGADTITVSLGGNTFNVQRAETDTSTSQGQLLKAKGGKLYIDVKGDGSDLIAIVDSGGGSPTFDSSSSWSGPLESGSWSQESIAVEKQSDGTYKLAVKNTNTYNNTTDVNWNVYTISSSGVLDWSNSTWGGITKHEQDFNQDLNGDGGIGLTAALKSVSTDTTGARLKRDAENGLYIDVDNDGTNIIAIEDNYGGTPTFDNSGSWKDEWSSSSWSQESVAVEKQSDGTYKLAVKNTNTYNGTTDINWNIYSISSSGALDWSNSSWGGITKHEQDFNQDLNNDGGIGLLAALKSVSTDTTGARLKRDAENGLYIDVDNDGKNIIAIEDNYGGTPTFDNSGSWTDEWSSSSWSQESVAVEKQSDGTYKLAVKNTNSWSEPGDTKSNTEVNWQTFTISDSGILDWSNSSWGGITKQEDDFNQDLNGDGGIGLLAALKSVSTDTTGARLKRDSENGLYIDVDNDGKNIIAIEDNNGGTPTFDNSGSWKDEWSSSSWSSESYAVEKQSDGSFKLAVKHSDTYNGTTNSNWNVYSISSSGVLDWSNSTWGGIAKHEVDFNQDLNGDDGIGLTAALKAVSSDTTGARLKRDSEQGLYIDVDNDGTNIIPIEDNYGGSPTFDYSNSWSDGINTNSWSQESVAIEKQKDGTYKLAVKNTNSWDGNTETNWNTYTVSSSGILDWSNSTWGGIAKHEDKFNQDLNGDGGIGLTAALQSVSTDTTGARLKRDSENGLYIDVSNDGTNIISIVDQWGGSPNFDHSNSWNDTYYGTTGSWVQESVAVEAQKDGSFKLAVKSTDTYNGTATTNWQTFSINSSGVLDWSNSTWGGIAKHEEKFNQDLNDDSSIGISSTTLKTATTDTTGARLKRDAENGLYIDVNNDGQTILSIVDSYGNSPNFDNSQSWFDGSYSQESFAVEKQDDGSFKLAIKTTNTQNDTVDVNWNVYSISSLGVLDWSNSTWGGVAKHEENFNQDLNGDGSIGISTSLIAISADQIGARLKKDTEGALYIDVNNDGSNVIAITDEWGGTPNFDHSSSWSDGSNTNSWSQESVAVEEQNNGSFKLAVKNTDIHNGETATNWNVYSVSSSGILDWSNNSWGAISKHENDFNQDLNGDGALGVSTSLTSIATDTTGELLKEDSENALYIVDGTSKISITDEWGGTPSFTHSNSWSDGTNTNSWTQAAVAVEKQKDNSYRLAVKNTNNDNGVETIDWNVYSVNSAGVLDWSTSTWGGITKHETKFNQDLNGDGEIGLIEALTTISTDETGALLKRDSEYGLYIDDAGTIIEIVDTYGGQPKFDNQSTWTDGTNSSQWKEEAYATQKLSDDSFVLAVKSTNTYNEDVNIDWAIYKVSSAGVIDWNASWGAASKHELDFGQDLNGDGVTGRNTTLEKIATDTVGAELRRDNEGVLYIDNDGDDSTTEDIITITDQYGGTPTFNHSSEWKNGDESSNWLEEAIAVEKQSDNNYRLAVKTTNTYNNTTEVNWTVYSLSESGVLDWETSEWHPNTDNIALTTFNQDLGQLDSNSDRASVTADVMVGAGGQTSEAVNSPVQIVGNEELSTATLEQTAKDIGSAAAIKPLTDLMDFKINISDASQYGTIQSVSFKLSATESNLSYYKLNSETNTYYKFDYDSATGEGARFTKSNDSLGYNDIMTLYIRDNGEHDSDSASGVIRDPGYVGSVATATIQKAENTIVEADNTSSSTATSSSGSGSSSGSSGSYGSGGSSTSLISNPTQQYTEISTATSEPTVSQQPLEITNEAIDLINISSIGSFNFSQATTKAIKKTDWNDVGFKSFTPGSTAAETLNWGAINYKKLDKSTVKSLDTNAIDLSDLTKSSIRKIAKNDLLDSVFEVKKIKGDYQGNDEVIDIITAGKKTKNLEISAGAGPDLFRVKPTKKSSLTINDYEPKIDVIQLDHKKFDNDKLNVIASDNGSDILFKRDLLISLPGINPDAVTL